METITKRCVLLNAQATDKQSAIRLAGQLLVDAGYIDPAYVASFEKREAVVAFDDAKSNIEAITQATANAGYPSTLKAEK